MAAPEGGDLYHSYCTQERRTFWEVLCDFETVALPLDVLVTLVPKLAARHFSVASAASLKPGTVELCVAVVAYRTKFGRDIRGVCSSWLAASAPGVCRAVLPCLALWRWAFAHSTRPIAPCSVRRMSSRCNCVGVPLLA